MSAEHLANANSEFDQSRETVRKYLMSAKEMALAIYVDQYTRKRLLRLSTAAIQGRLARKSRTNRIE